MAWEPGAQGPGRRDWARLGAWLVGATLLYNLVEAAIALVAGLRARSIALVGFGLDSVIEMVAAAVVLWRLRLEARGERGERLARAERRVHRVVGATLLGLAAYVSGQAVRVLVGRDVPEESWVGIALAALSLLVMPVVSWGKLRAARELGSAALRAEALETLACSYLSFTLLLGLVARARLDWWWADPAAALLMVPWLVREGLEAFGEDACGGDSRGPRDD